MSGIVIVNYGMGNLGSVANALGRLGVEYEISDDPARIRRASGLVLPGVGAFRAAMHNLRERGLDVVLTEQVIGRKTPFLGICLGLQLLASDSTEQGLTTGLGWIEGHVVRMEPGTGHPVPHVGWNEVHFESHTPLFQRLTEEAHFFFDHSYHLQCAAQWVTATCDYGGQWVAAVQRENVHAVQFHPEKSQRNGLRVLRSFLNQIERR